MLYILQLKKVIVQSFYFLFIHIHPLPFRCTSSCTSYISVLFKAFFNRMKDIMLFVKTHNSGMATHCFRKREREIQNSQNIHNNNYIGELQCDRIAIRIIAVLGCTNIRNIFHDCHFLEVCSVTTGSGGKFSTFYSVANF